MGKVFQNLQGFGSSRSDTSGEPQHLVCCFETPAVCTVAARVMAGAAVRRRQRFLRSVWRHEQLCLRMMAATMSHHSWQSRASVGVQTDEAPAPVAEYIVPAPTPDPAVYTASAPVNEYVASSYVIEYVAPAPVTTLLEPPVPVVQVVQVRHVQIIEKTVETPVTHFGQGSQTP